MADRTDEVWKAASLAATYLNGVRGAIPQAAEQLDIMLRLIAAAGRPVRRFLDLGCGDGVLSSAILDQFPDAEGVLADFSAPMIEAAAKRFAGHSAPIHPLIVDYALPGWVERVSAWAPFDAIVSGYSIHHQPDQRKREIYAEIYGLLAPGAMFVNIEHVSSASAWVESVFNELFLDHLQRLHSAMSREEVAATYFHRLDKAANILSPVELQCQWLREIGFVDVDCYLKIFELAVFGGRR